MMQTNILKYWQHLENLPQGNRDRPSPRVCRLMLEMFEFWRAQSPFPEFGSLGHLRDHLDAGEEDMMSRPLPVRRGHALKKTLELLVGDWAETRGLIRMNPDELIVGTMPPYSVGQGKEVMDYLKDGRDSYDERLQFEMGFLNPWSNFGHVCPDYQRVVDRGLRAIIVDCEKRLEAAGDDAVRDFYTGAIAALEGVITFAEGYGKRAETLANTNDELLAAYSDRPSKSVIDDRINGMKAVAGRMKRIPAEPCESFTDAVQCIYILNCALHWTGELSSLGRLDQILSPFYEREKASGALTAEQAQEIIECFWVKLDENVVLDNRLVTDHFTEADGALLGTGGASNFDQGALTNQWMQQITLGGVVATDDESAEDACNDVTRMCLHAARKLPFNCPTLDLRVHKETPEEIIELAAEALLSGGAHPILMNDDKMVPALLNSGKTVELKSARNYACDGCYEALFAGETEFTFIYVPGVDVLEKALNSGAGFGVAGPRNLRGNKSSFRTPEAADISSFDQFFQIMEEHIWLGVNRAFGGLFHAYGSKAAICPSPILSAMIDGCIESGRDFYDGGAKYHMFAPLMTGISTVADSLYVLDRLVFTEKRFSLPELVACLRSNWGAQPHIIGRKVAPERANEIRQMCLDQPKFGFGNEGVDAYAWRLAESFCANIDKALAHPVHAEGLERLEKDFASKRKPFNMVITPGVGTFEQYVFGGSFGGATPDGRGAFEPLASDLAASPMPQSLDPDGNDPGADWTNEGQTLWVKPRRARLRAALSSWNNDAFDKLSDGAPADFNIEEDFPKDELVAILRDFADGKGGNMMTVTVANLSTLKAAEVDPLAYELLRVRMGGWSEYFSVLFPDHKKQHIRRNIYTA
jgi:pyruvate-formate lyase